MKIRIKIPKEWSANSETCHHFVDDVLFWGMETGMDIAFYGFWNDPTSIYNKPIRWAVFTIEADYSFMFTLKWGALLHKQQRQLEE